MQAVSKKHWKERLSEVLQMEDEQNDWKGLPVSDIYDFKYWTIKTKAFPGD